MNENNIFTGQSTIAGYGNHLGGIGQSIGATFTVKYCPDCQGYYPSIPGYIHKCPAEEAFKTGPQTHLTANKEEKEMAKLELTSDQKATIAYGRAKLLTEETMAFMLLAGMLTPTNVDKVIKYEELITAYDPSKDEDGE